MRILLHASAFNSLTQRVAVELAYQRHEISVSLDLGGGARGESELREAIRRHRPELVVAPMLTSAIPADVWSRHVCLIVHPGPPGDRGPSSLDWALAQGRRRWGVTVLQAVAEMDAGPVWATEEFDIPEHADAGGIAKSDLYRNELADAASAAVLRAVERVASRRFVPAPAPPGRARPYHRQDQRAIDWTAEGTDAVARKLRTADSSPGVLDTLGGRAYYLHGGQPEDELRGVPGTLLATREGAVCRATVDGAVWLTSLRPRRALPDGPPTAKAPAATVLGAAGLLRGVPEIGVALRPHHKRQTWATVRYHEHGSVGLLRFSFPGGAMSTTDCRRLLTAYRYARSRPTRVLVLGAHRDVFSHGIHLGAIEAAADPAHESWANINAMDDLVEAILTTRDKLTVAALGGNAAAGGLMLALAADEVWVRRGAVLNPHYRLMGLHGSEFWTYTLPRRVGREHARRLTVDALPVGPERALDLGLVDRILDCTPERVPEHVADLAQGLAVDPRLPRRLAAKRGALRRAEGRTPLAWYRAEELALMHRNFYGPDDSYHALRRAFLHKTRPEATPERLHRIPA
ncbi:enoyl-CoA hydratase-related protein [Streptacidiphilus jiangxiensis]|uniref:Putative two-component system protein, hydrogenase maturation factor HypX/HoxX n=1 Tax=Streptacidiphilus jiangxiensis TaxID=235985 RepID=A0A1H7XEX6_STRJI|nr:enoyl-CoA hydratase-related protein [Streptacidiphilus jiangxiensis]SEM31599.1 putative two-component system protein, hydrogenase maturation factor HypX/HoxX [Streptacidiphilus jiangxiensis]